jgi:ABC-type transporter Mla MlaB component
MRASFSITFMENGRFHMRVSGKLTGHIAREVHEFLQSAINLGSREIMIDLSEITSIDSLGIGIFSWIHGKNGNLHVDIFPPVRGVSDDEYAMVVLAASSVNTPDYRKLKPVEEVRT